MAGPADLGVAAMTAIGALGGGSATGVAAYYAFQQRKLKAYQKELENERKDLDQKQKLMESLQAQVADLTQQRNGLEDQWKIATEEAIRLDGIIAAKNKMIDALKDDASIMNSQRERVVTEMARLQALYEDVCKQRDGLLHLEKRHGGKRIEDVPPGERGI